MPTTVLCWQAQGLPFIQRCIAMVLLTILCTAQADDALSLSLLRLQHAAKFSQAATPAPVIDRSVFLQRPGVSDVLLAPDGRHLVYVKRDTTQADLVLQSVHDRQPVVLLRDIKRPEVRWAGDGKRLWLNDDQGLSVIDVASRKAKRIYKWDSAMQARLFRISPRAPQQVVVQEKIVDASKNSARYRYRLVDAEGQSQLIAETTWPWRSVLLDEKGRVQVLTRFRDASYKTVVSVPNGSAWRDVAECDGYVQPCVPLVLSRDGEQLWLNTTTQSPLAGVSQLSLSTGQYTVVQRDPEALADAYDVLVDHSQGNVLAASYYTDKQHWYAIDKRVETDLAFLHQQLPLADISIARSDDDQYWLITAEAAQYQFRRYFLYSPVSKKLQALFETETIKQAIPSNHLVPSIAVSYRASDGMLLHGFLYLPLGRDPKTVPLIAAPHGGPWSQERGGYSAMVQLIVNRGYAVFTPNFRASEGYGLDYLLAAKGDFGTGRVLQDTIDGMDYLLAQGVGDTKKQAIGGHSFGGYTTLLALGHYPDRFVVGVATAAPHDFAWTMQKYTENESEALRGNGPAYKQRFPYLGVPLQDANWVKKMASESPASLSVAVKSPLYLWAGEKDERVPIKGMTYYAALLKKAQKLVSFVLDGDSMHNPTQPINQEALLYMFELGFTRHLGGATASKPSPELAKFLTDNVRIDANGAFTSTSTIRHDGAK